MLQSPGPRHHRATPPPPAVVESLIAAGAKVNDVGGAHGQTALHLAAREGLVQVADKLVQRGAQNRPDVNGRCANGSIVDRSRFFFASFHTMP